MTDVYRIHEFARLADVSVRTLHHYDRVGLLKPQRTQAGYRLYTARDLERLEQILALKFLGMPLTQVKALLNHKGSSLADSLQMQRAALEEKREMLDRAIGAIRDAEKVMERDQAPKAKVLATIIAAFKEMNNMEFMEKYFSEEAWAKWSGRRKALPLDEKKQASQAWIEFYRDAEGVLGEDPGSDVAQRLTARWLALEDATSDGDKDIKAGFRKAWLDRQNWPAKDRQRIAEVNLENIADFIGRAMGASMKKYYSDEAWAKLTKLRQQTDSASRQQTWAAWRELFRDVDASLDEHPASKAAQELATRWMKLVEKSTGDDPDVKAGAYKAWQNRQAWPENLQEQFAEFRLDEIGLFIRKALALRWKPRPGPRDFAT
jgi:MerR family transcriptional regulator, thiopeptide resistance regulator